MCCSKRKIKNSKPLNIQYDDIKIKQYSEVTYLGCISDKIRSEESLVIHIINKLRFPYHQNRSLNGPLHRLLCNAMIQPFWTMHVILVSTRKQKTENAFTSHSRQMHKIFLKTEWQI